MSSMEGFKRLGITAGGLAMASTLLSTGVTPGWTQLQWEAKWDHWLDAAWKAPMLYLVCVLVFIGFGWLLDTTRHLGWLRQTCLFIGGGSAVGVVVYFASWLRTSELAEPGYQFVLALVATVPSIFIATFAVPLVVLRLSEWIVEGFRTPRRAPASSAPYPPPPVPKSEP